ncbi:hypothetical protein D082_12570 [Synechocystis sp. PCC 6714]|nr:hypothetical protein D082_12570 [Synechocystis sp. PCC 6714]
MLFWGAFDCPSSYFFGVLALGKVSVYPKFGENWDKIL